MDEDSYDVLSRYYDAAYGSKADLRDIPFYVDRAGRTGGPVLEIGCGTGRVLLEIAARGIAVEGLDASEGQLRVLEKKLESASAETRNRIRLHRADMRDFALNRKFPLVIAPFRPLQHLYTVSDQISALQAIRKHLLPDGFFAFDAFYPNYSSLEESLGIEKLDLEWMDPEAPGRTIRRYFVRERNDKLNQVFSGHFIFRNYEGDRVVAEERERVTMSYYTYPQFLTLFELCGYRIVEEYGDFDRSPISVCREMIFVLSPK
jgi:SAM-dependent methyltransferase